MERMLVTQALDERDLLKKKIVDKIKSASFVDTCKHNEERLRNSRLSIEEFKKNAEASYQQINSYIDRYQRIEAALVLSNATNYVETSYGKYTVAEAIAIKRRLNSTTDYTCAYDADFENILCSKIKEEYEHAQMFINQKNSDMQSTADDMRMSILGKDSKAKDQSAMAIVDVYIKENTTEIIDPLNVRGLMESLNSRKDLFARELETQIKVSNATSFIEI